MIDVPQLIFEFLTTSGTGLFTLVGNRVWCPLVDANSGWKNETAAIVYHPATESNHGAATAVITGNYVFKCYGGTKQYTNARAVYRALNDRLHGVANEAKTEGSIIWAEQVVSAQLPPEPGTSYPAHMATYKIIAQ